MDGMAELLQFGDEGFHHVAVDLALTEAFILSTVAGTLRGVPLVYVYSDDSHLLSSYLAINQDRCIISWGCVPFHSIALNKKLDYFW